MKSLIIFSVTLPFMVCVICAALMAYADFKAWWIFLVLSLLVVPSSRIITASILSQDHPDF